jgi:hypothetical protein
MTCDAPILNRHSSGASLDDVKRKAAGNWTAVLNAAGLPHELLDGRGHPCPKCGGTDRFSAFRDVETAGGVMCRRCFNEKNGDGFAALMWLRDCSFPEAVEFVAETLGIHTSMGAPRKPDVALCIVESVADAKKMPLMAFQQFGAESATRGKQIVARVPVYDEHGEVHSYFDLTPDGKGLFKRGKGSSGMFFPGQLPQAGETWLLVEGVKDAAALVGLGYLAAGLPRNEMSAMYAQLFQGCEVIVVPDLDVPGIDGAQCTAGRLAGIAASVSTARLPGEVVKSGGQDVRDVIAREGGTAVCDAVSAAEAWEPSDGYEDDERPEVLLTFDEAAVANAVMEEVGRLGWETPWLRSDEAVRARIYQRGGGLVHVIDDSPPDDAGSGREAVAPQIRTLPKAILRERITQAVRLIEEVESGNEIKRIIKRPPDWLVSSILERGEYGAAVRRLVGIVQTPTLRPDGSIIQELGYDVQTGVLFLPHQAFPNVPENPSQAEAKQAAEDLLEVVVDFPFASDSDRAVWVALVLTLLARPAISGPCPLFVFDANIRAAGKSKLADVAGIIASGVAMPRKTWPSSDSEVRKTITAIALEGWRAIFFDNVDTTLGGASLDAALTATTWHDRVLGESRTTGILPLTTIWIATGNNIEFAGDTPRRTLFGHLESLEEHPEDRTDFTHPNLERFVRENRGRLAVAGLTMLRAYFAANCPESGLRQWGSFEEWSKLIREALVFSELPDPYQASESVRKTDRSAELLKLIHAGIAEADVNGVGLTTAEIERLLSRHIGEDDVDSWPTLRMAITELCGAKTDSRRIGYGLRRYRDRVSAGRRLTSQPGRGGVSRWLVEPMAGHVVMAGSPMAVDASTAPLASEAKAVNECDDSNWDARDNVEVF